MYRWDPCIPCAAPGCRAAACHQWVLFAVLLLSGSIFLPLTRADWTQQVDANGHLSNDDLFYLLPPYVGNFGYPAPLTNTSGTGLVLNGPSRFMKRVFTDLTYENYLELVRPLVGTEAALPAYQQAELSVGSAVFQNHARVRYGFVANFSVRIRSFASRRACLTCDTSTASLMDDDSTQTGTQYTGHSFSFFLSNDVTSRTHLVPGNLQAAGAGLGINGLNNSLAVVFDLISDPSPSIEDPPTPHVSVHFRGATLNSASHAADMPTTPPPAYGALYVEYPPVPWNPAYDQANYSFPPVNASAGTNISVFDNPKVWRDLRRMHTYVNSASMPNYIYPNVTPAYNWADVSMLLDAEIHHIRIEYDVTPEKRLSVFLDDEDDPRLSVLLDVGKLDLDESYLCRAIPGCFGLTPWLVDPTTFQVRVRPYCGVTDSSTGAELFSSPVTIGVDGMPWTMSSSGSAGPCYGCYGYEKCAAWVGLIGSIGSTDQMWTEIFDFNFSSLDPPPFNASSSSNPYVF